MNCYSNRFLTVFFALSVLTTASYAQVTSVRAPNTNRSAGLKSGIFSGSANFIRAFSMASVIGGGQRNEVRAFVTNSMVGGGLQNVAAANYATVAGGAYNYAGYNGTVSGGAFNLVPGNHGFIGGGFANTASGQNTVVSGGWSNLVTGSYSTVPGGAFSQATNDGSFVWSGTTNITTSSTNAYSFTVRAPGGVRFISSMTADSVSLASGPYNSNNIAPFTNGVYLAPNSGAWASLSDSNLKTKITAIKPREILAKLSSLPITQWEYKSDPDGRRYIGPMAQDFRAAFGLGADDKTISTLDSDGVMYAAIQGVVEELKAQEQRHKDDLVQRDELIKELSRHIHNLKVRLDDLPPAP